TVITATLRPKEEFVMQAWKSIVASAPKTWEFEWCIQEDGEGPYLRELLPDDERIRYEANHIPAGVGATRNAAIRRARGEWFLNIDGDDFYTHNGFALLTEMIDNHPTAIWVGGRAHDYLHERGEIIE